MIQANVTPARFLRGVERMEEILADYESTSFVEGYHISEILNKIYFLKWSEGEKRIAAAYFLY